MRTIRTIIILIILLTAAFLVYIYSGIYNIAATAPHSELATWIFQTTKKYSIQKHAENIEQPELNREELIRTGFDHYDSMCAGCHGAPGSESAEGFNPAPPDLAEKAGKFRPAELFWIIKSGIKMTGMPEFGSTHTEDELWGIVAFTAKLPDISPEQYKIMKEESENAQQQHNHDHRQPSEAETTDGNANENPDERDGSEHEH